MLEFFVVALLLLVGGSFQIIEVKYNDLIFKLDFASYFALVEFIWIVSRREIQIKNLLVLVFTVGDAASHVIDLGLTLLVQF